MLIDEDNDNGLVLVDFSFRPVDVLSSITCWLLNARRQDKKDVDLLYDHASLLCANRDFKIQECINKTEARHRQAIDEEKIKKQFEEFHQLMNQILHKHAVFDFRFENLGNYENL